MSPPTHLFCCPNIQHTHSPNPEHEQTFTEFTRWAITTIPNPNNQTQPSTASQCIQLIRQVPSGPIESTRYFIATKHGNFEEIPEKGFLDASFTKTNEHKTLLCTTHNRIFDVVLYQNATAWRNSIAKPLRQLEQALRRKASSGPASGSGVRRSSSVYGYGSGMGYGSGWGSSLGSGWGPDWGIGGMPLAGGEDKVGGLCEPDRRDDEEGGDVSSSSSSSSGSDDGIRDVDGDGIVDADTNDVGDEAGSSASLDVESGREESLEDREGGPCSPETQVAFSDSIVDQSFCHVEDYGYYYTERPSDDYGSYDYGDDYAGYDYDGLDVEYDFD